jgi:competence protein ComGC
MKQVLLVLSLLSLFSCSVKKNQTDWHKDGLKKEVKIIQDRIFLAELDNQNNIIKGKEVGGLFIGNQKKHYNKKGLLEEKIIFREDNKTIDTHQRFKYNRRGICIKKIEFYSNGDIKSKETFKYKRKSNYIEGQWINSDKNNYANPTNKIYFEFDKLGNLVKTNNVHKLYDLNNNLITSTLYYEGTNHKLINDYKYDEYGIITKVVQTTSLREIVREFTYKLDNVGNWIEKIEFQEGKPKFVIERLIKYY